METTPEELAALVAAIIEEHEKEKEIIRQSKF
jgi:hypothetical protein